MEALPLREMGRNYCFDVVQHSTRPMQLPVRPPMDLGDEWVGGNAVAADVGYCYGWDSGEGRQHYIH